MAPTTAFAAALDLHAATVLASWPLGLGNLLEHKVMQKGLDARVDKISRVKIHGLSFNREIYEINEIKAPWKFPTIQYIHLYLNVHTHVHVYIRTFL